MMVQLELPGFFTPATKDESASMWMTVAADAPTAILLMCYRSLWIKNPLWLVNIPGVADPRRDPDQAIDDAHLVIERYERVCRCRYGQDKIAIHHISSSSIPSTTASHFQTTIIGRN